MSKSILCCGSKLVGAIAALAVGCSIGSAKDFYSNKTITILVGYTPGGGYDAYARALGQFLPAHIPGRPSVVVQNMPGAASLTAAQSVDLVEPKDGTVLVTFNPGLITQSLVQPDKVPADFRKYAWIGVVTPDFRVCYGYGPHAPDSFKELLRRKEFVLGTTAKGSSDYVNGAVLRDVLHAPVRQVLGFPGSAEQHLAIERGEVDGACGSWSSVPNSWIQANKEHAFVRFTRETLTSIPTSATFIDDLAKTQADKDLLDMLDAEDEIGRSFTVSRDIPTDRLAVLRNGFAATMGDPGFLALMKKEDLPVNPIDGQAADEVITKILAAPQAIIQRAKKLYE